MQELNSNEIIIHFTAAEAEKAFQLAKQKQLPVLVDFWAPGCKGCNKMESLVPHWQELLSAYPENVWGQRAEDLNITL